MKHPVWDRVLILFCALAAACGAAGSVALLLGKLTFDPFMSAMEAASFMGFRTRAILVAAAVVLALLAILLIAVTLPAKKKRSSTFAIQHNENGTVRISLKALESLVHKCLDQHAELKVVTSSLFSDEESIRVDIHITLQSDISMPLAISALQKQVKKYLEACSGVTVQEVRVFVDGTTPATGDAVNSPYAIPASLLGMDTEALPESTQQSVQAPAQEPATDSEPAAENEAETQETETQEDESVPAQEQDDAPIFRDEKDQGDWA